MVGIWEAADLQWWWRIPRPSDGIEQIFWVDEEGPAAAVVLTDWTGRGGNWSCDPVLLGGLGEEFSEMVLGEALSAASARRDATTEIAVREDDAWTRERLTRAGFAPASSDTTAWLAARDRAPITAPPSGYRLVDRTEIGHLPHHLAKRNGPTVESRLQETSLYDATLDLACLTGDEEVAAYGLFWFDPVTGTGLVEPMRTEEAHQKRGLAAHILRAGVGRLAERGASRIKISYHSEAAGSVYRAAGFVPTQRTVWFAREGHRGDGSA